MILFLAHPRGDTKPLAKQLLSRFGSLSGILQADSFSLKEIKGVGETTLAVFKLLLGSINAVQLEKTKERPIIGTSKDVLLYLQGAMAHLQKEQFRIIFLDAKNYVLGDEVQNQGTIDQTSIYPREVVKRALELGAKGLIMVHNHPSGDSTPSTADVDMTLQVKSAAKTLGISLYDHLVIGRGNYTSFRERGIL